MNVSKTQRYVSAELTHFVGKNLSADEERYSLLCKILNSRELSAPPHDPLIYGNLVINTEARFSENYMYSSQVICFCDIPVNDLGIHMDKYSHFALSFLKSFLVQKGANPVFYISKNSEVYDCWGAYPDEKRIEVAKLQGKNILPLFGHIPQSEYFDQMIRKYHTVFRLIAEAVNAREGIPEMQKLAGDIRNLEHFLDFHMFGFIKCFDDALSDGAPENYYMEREWRMLQHLTFSLSDVRRVILPEQYARRFRDDIPDYFGQLTFSDTLV